MSVFSLYGRARRSYYGVFFMVTIVAYLAMGIPYLVWMVKTDQDHILEKMQQSDPHAGHMFDFMTKIPDSVMYGALILSGLLLLLLYFAWIATCVRRLHDMKLTGWLVLIIILIALFPILGYLFVSLILGIWPGSKGPNRYGPDPRGRLDVADVFGAGPNPEPRMGQLSR